MSRDQQRDYLYRTFFKWFAVCIVIGFAITAICWALSVGPYVRLAVIGLEILGTFALMQFVAARHKD
jgi:hypothetical protein